MSHLTLNNIIQYLDLFFNKLVKGSFLVRNSVESISCMFIDSQDILALKINRCLLHLKFSFKKCSFGNSIVKWSLYSKSTVEVSNISGFSLSNYIKWDLLSLIIRNVGAAMLVTSEEEIYFWNLFLLPVSHAFANQQTSEPSLLRR